MQSQRQVTGKQKGAAQIENRQSDGGIMIIMCTHSTEDQRQENNEHTKSQENRVQIKVNLISKKV